MKTICPTCQFCQDMCVDETGKYFWCQFDHVWVNYANAITSDLDCDAYVEELDDHETEEHSA